MKINFTAEKEPVQNDKFEDGIYKMQIIGVEETTSKQGNQMIVISLRDTADKKIKAYCINVEGKRWLLGNLIKCCKFPIDAEGNSEFELKDFNRKVVLVKIENEEKPWVNRQGEKITVRNSKVTNFIQEEQLTKEDFGEEPTDEEMF